jgi:hypothetical protein
MELKPLELQNWHARQVLLAASFRRCLATRFHREDTSKSVSTELPDEYAIVRAVCEQGGNDREKRFEVIVERLATLDAKAIDALLTQAGLDPARVRAMAESLPQGTSECLVIDANGLWGISAPSIVVLTIAGAVLTELGNDASAAETAVSATGSDRASDADFDAAMASDHVTTSADPVSSEVISAPRVAISTAKSTVPREACRNACWQFPAASPI